MTKTCPHCGLEFIRTYEKIGNWATKRYCSRRCASTATGGGKLTDVEKKQRKAAYAKECKSTRPRLKNESRKATFEDYDQELAKHPANIQQREINRAIDEKYKVTLEYNNPAPGSPEFLALCAAATPLDRIRKGTKGISTFAEIDRATGSTGRRRENISESRG